MSRLEERVGEKKNRRVKKVFAIIGILLALLAVASASYFWFGGGFSEKDKDKEPDKENIISAQNKINIMVLGVDERGDDVGRSDTLFVVTIDTNTKEVAMLSIPRDTRVKIPGKGWDKINHAYAFGGHKLTQQVVELLLSIKIDHHIMVNIAGFKKIIDAIGGVTIDVEKKMYYNDPYDDNGGLVIDLRKGVQRMDGNTAIQYVRYRDEEGDIGRVERQQKFLKAVLSEVASPSVITKIPNIIREVSSVIKSDMSTSEMLNLAKIFNDASKNGLKTDMVPGKPGYIDEVSYWLPDVMALRQHVAQTLGVTLEEKYVTATQREATEYETSIPKEMKIVEVPKATKTTKEVKPPEKAKPTEKENTSTPAKTTETSKAPAKRATNKVRVEVVNASGSPEAAEKITSSLRAQGIEVVGVSNVSSSYKNTVVISNTDDSSVVSKLNGLPFKYSLQVTNDEGKNSDAVVVIGKDYVGK